MMGQAEGVKRKRPQMREHQGGSVGVGGSLCLISAESRKPCPALPCQLLSSEPKAPWYTKFQVGPTLLYHSEPLIRDTPEPTGASGSEAQACQTSGSIFISALACPLQPGLASLIRGHPAGLHSLMSVLREKHAFHSPSKAGGFPRGSFGSQGCHVIAEATIEILSLHPRVLKTPMENEQAWSPTGLGCPDTFLKLHFCVVPFKTFGRFQEIHFLINVFISDWSQAIREQSRCRIQSVSNSTG